MEFGTSEQGQSTIDLFLNHPKKSLLLIRETMDSPLKNLDENIQIAHQPDFPDQDTLEKFHLGLSEASKTKREGSALNLPPINQFKLPNLNTGNIRSSRFLGMASPSTSSISRFLNSSANKVPLTQKRNSFGLELLPQTVSHRRPSALQMDTAEAQ